MKSVLWTDFIQGSVLLVGVTFALLYLVHGIDGGFGTIFSTMAHGKFLAPDQPLFSPNILKDSVFLLIVGAGFNTCSSYVSSQNPLPPAAQQDQIFASYIAYQLPVGITGILLAAIYAASQSTLSTGLNSVATSWTLDIQERLSRKKMSFALQTRIAQYVSLGVGFAAILVSMVLANGEIKSAYEWFNGFMGLVLGVLGGTFVLGTFTKVASAKGAYIAFFTSAVVMAAVKYMAPAGSVPIWSYSIISIGISMVVGIPGVYLPVRREFCGKAGFHNRQHENCAERLPGAVKQNL